MSTSKQHANFEQLSTFVAAVLPEFDWVLAEMERAGGWLRLKPPLVNVLTGTNLRWWSAYESDKAFAVHQALMFLDPDTLRSIQTQEEADIVKGALVAEALEMVSLEEIQDSRPYTEEEKKTLAAELERKLASMSPEERREYWQKMAFFWIGYMITFLDLLSLMVHGKSLRILVQAARDGDDDSLIRAVQIDKAVLFVPCFQKRLLNAHLSGDEAFLNNLAYRVKNPIIKGKIKHRTLWLLFAILDSEGHLEMPLGELLALCEKVGVYGREYGIGDDNSLSKIRNDYLRKHRRQRIF